jgi:hypothetical protein
MISWGVLDGPLYCITLWRRLKAEPLWKNSMMHSARTHILAAEPILYRHDSQQMRAKFEILNFLVRKSGLVPSNLLVIFVAFSINFSEKNLKLKGDHTRRAGL